MARDRQRAKQRRARRAGREGAAPEPDRLHRENVPGELDHVSGQVEQFEAALVAGSGGEPVADEVEPTPEPEFEPEEPAEAAEGDELTAAEHPAADTAAQPTGAVVAPTARGRGRTIAFLRASWAELQRVQWPDRRQVAQATAVVLGFVLVAGAYLGLADAVAQRIVDFIL